MSGAAAASDRSLDRAVAYARVSTRDRARAGSVLARNRQRSGRDPSTRATILRSSKQLWLRAERRGGPPVSMLRSPKSEAPPRFGRRQAHRLSRSSHRFAGLVVTAQREVWALVVLDIGVDLAMPHGRLVAGLLASVAQWERELIGERTKAALRIERRIKRRRRAGCMLAHIGSTLQEEGVPTVQGGAPRPYEQSLDARRARSAAWRLEG